MDLPIYDQYHKYLVYATSRKGYSGVGFLTKIEPISYIVGIGEEEGDREGRCLTLEFENLIVISVYVPNSKMRLKRLDYRVFKWETQFRAFLASLKLRFKGKPILVLGDLNVAAEPIDLFDPASSGHAPGYSPEERLAFRELVKSGFVDTYRHLHPEKVQYTWWSYFDNARKRGLGWRIDYSMVSKEDLGRVVSSTILDQVHGSDHCPIEICIDLA